MEFSHRTPSNLNPNSISRVQNQLESGSLLDLTLSNPTQCGFHYPPDLFDRFQDPQAFLYEPEPFGLPRARQAVADYLNARGSRVDVSQVMLTSSTSEAYSILFKLLGNPGDSILVPTPGYPLLDHLLRLEALEPLPYRLRQEPEWPVDWSVPPRTRSSTKGVVVVNPHNPTGSFLSGSDQSSWMGLCRQHQWAYISDEVFTDFNYSGRNLEIPLSEEVLSFRLGGLSKSLGLPQLKLSWIVMTGPEGVLEECRERLELIADTYLSVNRPVQLALEGLFKFAQPFQRQVLERIKNNRLALEKGLGPLLGVKIWSAQAGWYALLEIKKGNFSEEELVIKAMKEQGVLVHPGGFYDFQEGCFLVLSLLPPTKLFTEGTARLRNLFERSGV